MTAFLLIKRISTIFWNDSFVKTFLFLLLLHHDVEISCLVIKPVSGFEYTMCSHCPPLTPSLKEISKNAVFVEGTTGTTDICQGQLGEYIRKTSLCLHTELCLSCRWGTRVLTGIRHAELSWFALAQHHYLITTKPKAETLLYPLAPNFLIAIKCSDLMTWFLHQEAPETRLQEHSEGERGCSPDLQGVCTTLQPCL